MFAADTPAVRSPWAIDSTTARRVDWSGPDCVLILIPTTSVLETKCRQAAASSVSPVRDLIPAVTITRTLAASTAKLLIALGSRTRTTRLFVTASGVELVSSAHDRAQR